MDDWLAIAASIVAAIALLRIGIAIGRRRSGDRGLSGPPPQPVRDALPRMKVKRERGLVQTIPEDLQARVAAALTRGHKIEAIKLVREATGMGLKEAKDVVEAMERGH